MATNLNTGLNFGLNPGLRQSISGGVDSLGLFRSSSLDLRFADKRTLADRVSGNNLITFSRSSGTGYGATYVDSDGLIKTSPVNLLRYSEQIDQWDSLLNETVTVNATEAPDGSMTADRVVLPASTGTYAVNSYTSTAGVHIGSVYVKAVTPGTNSNFTLWLGAQSSQFTATDEWQRVSFSINVTSDFRFGITNGDDSFISDVFVWGAQVEKGSVVNDYIPTQNVASGAPRYDFDPVTGESLGLLIEEERTNLVTDSTGAGFFAENVTRPIDSTIVNPKGLNGAFKLTSNVYDSVHRIRESSTSANSHVGSVFVKKGTSRYVLVGFGGMSHQFSALFDIEPGLTSDRLLGQGGRGTYSNINAGYEEFPNDWIRIWASGTTTGTNGLFVGFAENNTTFTLTNFIGSTADTFYVWGLQYEDNATFPTSFIETSGSSVTRSPDIATIEGNKFAKTNLLSYSERLEQSAWLKTSTTVIPNNLVAPDGSQTAELVLDDTTLISHVIKQTTPTLKNATDYTFSVYVKAASLNYCFLGFYLPSGGMPTGFASFDLVNNTSSIASGSPVANIQDVGNGWKRIAITETTTSAATTRTGVRLSQDGVWNNRIYTGSGQGIYLWGAQLEEGELTEYTPSVDTFDSRASSATYVDDATGLIKTTPVNLLTYSEQFDQWTKGSNTTVTPNAIEAPDGTLTADRVVNPAQGNTFVGIGLINVGVTYTASVYAKAATPGTNDKFTFNLGGGTLTNASSQFTATSEWQRFTFTHTPTSVSVGGGSNMLFINNEGDGFTSDVYIWGAQLEANTTTASPYVKTNSTITGAARYENGELLLEPARTNLLKYSEKFNDSAWTKMPQVSVTPNVAIAPDGTQTADNLIRSSTNTHLYQAVNGVGTHTLSCFVRSPSGDQNFKILHYNSTDGTLGSGIIYTATTEWQRFENVLSPTVNGNWYPVVSINANVNLEIWGAQLEAAPYASSYIPTTSSSVTRAQDVSDSTLGVDSWYKQSSGTFVTTTSSVTNLESANARAMFQVVNDSLSSDIFRHYLVYRGLANDFFSPSRFNSINAFNPTTAGNPTYNNDTIAYGYSSSELSKIFYDGSLLTASSSILDWTTYTANKLFIGGNAKLNGHIKRLAYFPTLKTDQELVNMTS